MIVSNTVNILRSAQIHDEMEKEHVEDVNREFYVANPSVLKCWSLLKYCKDNFGDACRHIDQEHLTNLKRPKTSAEVSANECEEQTP